MMNNRVVIVTMFVSLGLYGTSGLIFVGMINGKSFFAEPNRTTWDAAKSRCEEGGMHLATIDSVDERSLVSNAYEGSAALISWYWIGARDSLTVSQLSWDHNNGTVSSSVMTPFRHRNGIQTCVNMYIGNSTSARFDAENCTMTYPSICELVHGKT